jgi:putative ABC transport system permease protein
MIWAVTWRNIWRNKLRSTGILIAIIVGIFSGVFSWAFYRGMVIQQVHSAILTESMHIQIHHNAYVTDPDQKFFIPDAAEAVRRIDTIRGIKAVTRRLLVNGMITSAETGTGVKVFGIDPAQESRVTNIFSKITEGTYFKGHKKIPAEPGRRT